MRHGMHTAIFGQLADKGRKIAAPERQPGCHGVAAKPFQTIAGVGKRVIDGKAIDTAAGALQQRAVVGIDDGRLAVAVNKARGNDADDAAGKAGVAHHDDGLGQQRRVSQKERLDALLGLLLQRAAGAVVAVDLLRILLAVLLIEQQHETVAGRFDAAGGVEAWGNAEGDRPRRELLLLDGGQLKQRRKAGVGPLPQLIQTGLHDLTIF